MGVTRVLRSFFSSLMGTYTVKMNMLYLINIIVATDYKQYYSLNLTN